MAASTSTLLFAAVLAVLAHGSAAVRSFPRGSPGWLSQCQYKLAMCCWTNDVRAGANSPSDVLRTRFCVDTC